MRTQLEITSLMPKEEVKLDTRYREEQTTRLNTDKRQNMETKDKEQSGNTQRGYTTFN